MRIPSQSKGAGKRRGAQHRPSRPVVIQKAEDYAELAARIANTEPPFWLVDFLKQSASSLAIDRCVHARRPIKTEMRERMLRISKAAKTIQSALEDAAAWEFLESEGGMRIDNVGVLDKTLPRICEQAEKAASSEHLGRGRGKALPHNAVSPETNCAVIVVELWRHFHNTYPRPGHGQAHAIADDYWRLSGGTNGPGVGSNPLNRWRHHFKKANSPATESIRARIRHYLAQARHFQAIWDDCK